MKGTMANILLSIPWNIIITMAIRNTMANTDINSNTTMDITTPPMEVSTRAWYSTTACTPKIRTCTRPPWRKPPADTKAATYNNITGSIPQVPTGDISIFPNFRALRPVPAFTLPPPSRREATIPIDRFVSPHNHKDSMEEEARSLTERPSLSSCFPTRPTVPQADLSCPPKIRPIRTMRPRTRRRRCQMITMTHRHRCWIKVPVQRRALSFQRLKTTLPRARPTRLLVTRAFIAIRPWI
mmetsp:Transcript_8153/g.14770  ORF Transcript_8153/g.14770 Transcript_8153/m.14770 type:complete len:240 (+) Transcript_8153:3090-3809(+)